MLNAIAKRYHHNNGFSLIELTVSIFLISLIFLSFYQLFINTISISSRTELKSRAYFLAQDAIEAAKNIRDRHWDEIENLTIASLYHPVEQNGEWQMAEGAETIDNFYTRQVVFNNVLRDVNGNIVQSGGTADPHMRQVTATVSWQGKDGVQQAALSNYLTNWKYMNNFVKYFTQTNQTDFEASADNTLDASAQPGNLILRRPVLYEENFESYGTGANPSYWYNTKKDYSLIQQGSLFRTFDLGDNMVIGTNEDDDNIHSHYHTTAAHNWANYQFSGRMMITDDDGGLGVTFSSQYPNQDKYYRLEARNSSHFLIDEDDRNIELSDRGTKDLDTDISMDDDLWYYFKVQVRHPTGQVHIISKVWPQSEEEPAFWSTDCFDESAGHPLSGTIGLWTRDDGNKYFDDILVEDLTNYTASGQLISLPYDAGAASDFGTIFWTASALENTAVRLQLRSADAEAGLTTAAWYGPTSSSDYYEANPSGEVINSVHDGDQWIQYRVTLTTNDSTKTPVFEEVMISYSN